MRAVRRLFRASCVAMAIAATTVGAQAATARLDGPAGPVLAGDSFVVTLRGLGFDSLDGGGVSLSFAPALLELTSVLVDASWEFFSAPGNIDNAAGRLTDMSFNTWNAKQGNFDIATLQFNAKAGGLASIELLESAMFPFGAGRQPADGGPGRHAGADQPAGARARYVVADAWRLAVLGARAAHQVSGRR